jgi:hypothetical protein
MADYQVTHPYEYFDSTDEYIDCDKCQAKGRIDEIGIDEDTNKPEIIGSLKCTQCDGTGVIKYYE